MEEYIWSIQKAYQTEEQEQEAIRAASKAGVPSDEMRSLSSQVDRLTLACQAMWELVRERTELTEEDLAQKIEEIDARDGEVDGKMGARIVPCPSCGRNSNSRRSSCVWCGEPIEREHAFEG